MSHSSIIKVLAAVTLLSGCAGEPELPAADVPVSAYRCEDGTRFTVAFSDGRALIQIEGGERVSLKQRRAASGMRYETRGTELSGRGREAVFKRGDRPQTRCLTA